jgi:hypothetical protein
VCVPDDSRECGTFQVTTTADNGDNVNPTPGSLRKAILDANANPGPDDIVFQIQANGVQTISPPTRLPNISDPVTIRRLHAKWRFQNTLFDGDNAVLMIQIEGTNGRCGISGYRFSDHRRLDHHSRPGRSIVSRLTEYRLASTVRATITSRAALSGPIPQVRCSLPNLVGGIYLKQSNDNVIGGTTPETS